ncbi:hypothetical protein [Psychromonas sp. SP041]|uniref:hypothetical protein n=1 Tax=Psychromonas sp. SP041 TaxID=1365007 RepID=UPI0010C7DA66|nr:hypothetical protein [Psychromonas sp. SP041]
MPHILIKHFPVDISTEDKEDIASEISKIISKRLSCPYDAISVSMEPVRKELWNKEIYEPEIKGKQEILIKVPQY